MVVPCEWDYVDKEDCPEIPADQQYHWECDPRNHTCADGQYSGYEPVTTPTTTTLSTTPASTVEPKASTDTPPAWNPDDQIPRELYHSGTLIFNPVITQNVGPVEANAGHAHADAPAEPKPTTLLPEKSTLAITVATLPGIDLVENAAFRAETQEKLKNMKKLLQASAANQEMSL